MVILAERFGGPEENDFIISVNRKELQTYLANLDIPYDAKSHNGANFFPIVAVFAKLTDNDFAKGGIFRAINSSLETIEVTKVGLVKLQNILKQYFKITLTISKKIINN